MTTAPWPSDDELDAAYEVFYRPEGGRFSGPGDAILRRTRAVPARRIDRLAPAGRVLDVGAGEGWLVDALRARGRDAVGIERGGDDLLALDDPFAAIVFWHSLEHLRRPGGALAHAARLLVPGGLLVIAVPDADSLQARCFGDRWFHLDPPRHLVHIPRATLLRTLRELGMRVQTVGGLRGGQVVFGWLHGLVGTLPGHPDLYDAARRPAARSSPIGAGARAGILAAATALAPVAVVAGGTESLLGRAGTTYVEAVR